MSIQYYREETLAPMHAFRSYSRKSRNTMVANDIPFVLRARHTSPDCERREKKTLRVANESCQRRRPRCGSRTRVLKRIARLKQAALARRGSKRRPDCV